MSDPQQPASPYSGGSAQPLGQPAPAVGQPAPYAGQNPQHAGGPQAPAQPPADWAGPGRAAFIIALALLAVNAVFQVGIQFLFRSSAATAVLPALSLIYGVVYFVASIVVIVLGGVALRRPGRQILAGIALGVGIAGLVGTVTGWIVGMLAPLISSL